MYTRAAIAYVKLLAKLLLLLRPQTHADQLGKTAARSHIIPPEFCGSSKCLGFEKRFLGWGDCV